MSKLESNPHLGMGKRIHNSVQRIEVNCYETVATGGWQANNGHLVHDNAEQDF